MTLPLAAAGPALTAALTAALAGEHAAVYGYGVVGARLEGRPDQVSARQAFDGHRARRAALEDLLRAAGTEPVAAEAAYDLGGPVTTAAAARALAARLERGVAATYADLVAAGEPGLRSTAARWLVDAAVRGSVWSGVAEDFPGLTERRS